MLYRVPFFMHIRTEHGVHRTTLCSVIRAPYPISRIAAARLSRRVRPVCEGWSRRGHGCGSDDLPNSAPPPLHPSQGPFWSLRNPPVLEHGKSFDRNSGKQAACVYILRTFCFHVRSRIGVPSSPSPSPQGPLHALQSLHAVIVE